MPRNLRIRLSGLIVILSIVVCGLTASATAAEQLRKFEIGGGSIGGTYYISAAAFADLLSKKLGMAIPFTASATKGSGENIGLLDADRIEAATVSANGLYTAWNGLKPYKKQYRNMRVVMRVFPNPAVFFALKDSGITRISELKGKRVGCGSGPVTWEPVTRPILEAHGIDYDKGVRKVFGGFSDLCNQVRDKLLDASIGNVSAGSTLMPAISALAAEKELVFLEWDPKVLDTLPEELPYYTRMIVKAAVLPGRKADYATLCNGSQQIVVRDDLPDELVYRITKTIHENLSDLAKANQLFQYAVDHPAFMASKLSTIEFHPGSVRYWKEVGLWKE